jgi:hypothetical protein
MAEMEAKLEAKSKVLSTLSPSLISSFLLSPVLLFTLVLFSSSYAYSS